MVDDTSCVPSPPSVLVTEFKRGPRNLRGTGRPEGSGGDGEYSFVGTERSYDYYSRIVRLTLFRVDLPFMSHAIDKTSFRLPLRRTSVVVTISLSFPRSRPVSDETDTWTSY